MPTDADLLPRIDGVFPLTEDELKTEWRYIYNERLGMICGAADPTPEEDIMARDEADQHEAELRKL